LRPRGRYPHQAEQPLDAFFVDVVPLVPLQPLDHAGNAQPRVQQALLIDKAHELQVQGGLAHGPVIDPAAVDVQQLALAHHPQTGLFGHQVPALFFGLTHDEAFFKKSFSTLSCPIVFNSRSSFSSASVLASFAFLEKTSSPFFKNCDFQLVICVGWISYFLPSSWIVERSERASRTTLNLNFDVCFLLLI